MMMRFYQKINSTLKIFNRKYFERWAVVWTRSELPPITFLISYLKFWLNPNFQLFFIKVKIIISYKTFAKFPALECQLTMTPQPLSVKPTVALTVSRVTSEHFKSREPLMMQCHNLHSGGERLIWANYRNNFHCISGQISPTSQGPPDMTSC